MKAKKASWGVMLNAYPDSIGGTLADIVGLLKRPEFREAFTSFYILPSIFNTDLDRGFSLIDYGLSETLASPEALEELKALGIDLALDFILNHTSVLSKEFQDILKRGDDSPYRDFFIDWNRFWDGHGTMTEDGYIQPDAELIRDMFFRKPGLPILMVRFPDGRDVPYWNTFYQEVRYDPIDAQDLMRVMPLQYGTADVLAQCVNATLARGKTPKQIDLGRWNAYKAQVADYLEGHRKYLGQMDLNIRSPLVWDYYRDTLKTLVGYG
ncbi:glycosidase, partial [Phocaeicola vulgatus]